MRNQLVKTETNPQPAAISAEPEAAANVLLLGGLSGAMPRLSEPLAATLSAGDLILGALHAYDRDTAKSLADAGADVISLAGTRADSIAAVKNALNDAQIVGAGATEPLACAPVVLCVNDVRLGVLAYSERRACGSDHCADILSLTAYDQVRMLLNRCDHVIVLVRAGLRGAELPLPEWRSRYRRFIDAGASVVADTGAAKGWETYKNGLVFYGLGQPNENGALLLSLTLRQNGEFGYEARALEAAAGELRFSSDEVFKNKIDGQNRLFLDEADYLRVADEMCLRYYRDNEQPRKQGIFSALLTGKGNALRPEEERLRELLGDESRRFAVLRALAILQAENKT